MKFMVDELRVEICYAEPDEQVLLSLKVPIGSTAFQAIELSNILVRFPEIDLSKNPVGIFSRKVSLSQILRDGDRVEIYRPLLIDPKEIRRQKSSRDDRS